MEIDNTQFEKYSKAIVKLLDESLKNGEFFVYSKNGEYGMVISEERLGAMSISSNNKMERILKILQEPIDTDGWFTGKADKFKMKS